MAKKNLFDLNAIEPLKLSRSKIDLFLQCPRCFYFDRKLGISQPSGAPYTLNNTVDALLKREFDQYRDKREIHPFVKENGIDAIPFSHPEIENWRNNKIGIQHVHSPTNFCLYGAIDDVWQLSSGELVIVDYKAKATDKEITLEPKRKKNGDIVKTDRYLISYKKQIEFYQWLFQKNGFQISKTAYFVFANALKDRTMFDNKLVFEKFLIPYQGDVLWIDQTLLEIRKCLESDKIPDLTQECDICQYCSSINQQIARNGE